MSGCKKGVLSRGATLTSWISARSARPVEGFLQHHLNCWQHAEQHAEQSRQSSEICKKVHFRVPGVICFTAGEMSVAEVFEAGEDLPRLRLVLRSICLSQRQGSRMAHQRIDLAERTPERTDVANE